jgi:hypothetical protein
VTQRALLAIGCDTYDFLEPDLDGAELDAQRVYDQLIKPEVGGYDPARSRLLLSPTLAEVREAIGEIIYCDPPLDTFTLYFAGHGALDSGGFFMELRDTRGDRRPATAYWLSEGLMTLASKPPTVTNIILDACYAGGLANDVHVLVRPEIQGNAGTPAAVILAMASRDQFAMEDGDGGAGTNALLECLDGRIFIQEHAAALDLMDIGPAVGRKVATNPDQQPRTWALNVHQRAAFCRNPHFQASLDATFKHWSPRGVIDTVGPFLANHATSPADQVADVERLVSGLVTRAQDSRDMYLEAQVRASAVAALLPFCPTSVVASDYVEQQCLAVTECTVRALTRVVDELKLQKYALLSQRGGVSDLYVLPVRIWRIIGWSGAAYFTLKAAGREVEFPAATFAEFLDLIVEHYSLSAVLLSEVQGPSIAIGLACAAELGLQEQGEVLLGVLFNSVVETGGHVARGSIKNEQLFTYMLGRHTQRFEDVSEHVANPSEAIAVILRLAPLFGLADVFDDAMAELDHVNINAFVASDYAQFADDTIVDGDNHTFTIGHGIWTIDDLISRWPEAAAEAPESLAMRAGAMLSALLFPNRVPWFVVPPMAAEVAVESAG